MNPKQAFANRTARLLAEGAHKPRLAYTSSVEARALRMEREAAAERKALISRAEELACGEDFCFICSRPTDHFGEHSAEQILAWAYTPSLVQSLLSERFDD